jgi:uncharacterized protein (TIGR02270 family)
MLTQPVAEHLAEDAGFLWLLRNRQVHAPNVRLAKLVRFDERLNAQLEALAIGGNRSEGEPPMDVDHAGEVFLHTTLQMMSGASFPAAPDAALLTSYVAALSWVSRDIALATADALLRSADPVARAIAIAVLGTWRADPGPAIVAALNDPSPLVRARAYRTAGQLGRADLMAQIQQGLTDDDPECRFWSAWAGARMGPGEEPLDVLADIALNNQSRADRALDLLLRRIDVLEANSWLREFAKLPNRPRDLIRATGVIGDPLYVPWLIQRMAELPATRLAGEAFCMITGLDLAYHDLDRRPPGDFQSGPSDDPADENVTLDEDEHLPWPDAERVAQWWAANCVRFTVGKSYYLGTLKDSVDWLGVLSDAFQRQRHAAALELALRQPREVMFEVRARGRLQRQLIARVQAAR